MSAVFLVSALAAVTLFASAHRAMQREDPSMGLSLGTAALTVLAPYPFCLLLLPLAAVVHRVHAQHASQVRHEQENILALVQGTVDEGDPRIEHVRDPEGLAALQRFRESAREARDSLRREGEERHAEGRSTNVRARFMAAMGHELRSPLNSIIGFAQVLEDGADGPLTHAQQENVLLVRVAAEELLLLLTDILDSSRLEAGRVRLDRKWTASVEILTLTTQRTRGMLEQSDREIEAEVQPGLPALFVDRGRIAQALQNLVRQALRGGGRGVLKLSARSIEVSGKPMVRFDVTDPSRELSDADVRHAFDPDPEMPRATARSLALGLALGLARDLARLHGGDARCESAGGACWYLLLPTGSDTA